MKFSKLRLLGFKSFVEPTEFHIEDGLTGIVGPNGCGKSTLGRTMLQLHQPTGGEVFIDGENFFDLTGDKLFQKRKEFQIIFQDPYASLNPRMTVHDIITEGMIHYGMILKKDSVAAATRLVNEGWSLKKLHRLILVSSAFRQSSLGLDDDADPRPHTRRKALEILRRALGGRAARASRAAPPRGRRGSSARRAR